MRHQNAWLKLRRDKLLRWALIMLMAVSALAFIIFSHQSYGGTVLSGSTNYQGDEYAKWLYVKDADKNKTYLYFDGENLLLARYHKYSDPVHEGREGYWWHNAVGIYGARLSSLEGYDIVYEMSEMPSFKAPTLKKGLNVRLKDEVISGTVFKPREGFKYVYFFITEVFEDQGVIKYKLSKNWRGAAVIIVERDDILLVDY